MGEAIPLGKVAGGYGQRPQVEASRCENQID